MRGERVHVAYEGVDDALEMVSRNSLHDLLDDVVSICGINILSISMITL